MDQVIRKGSVRKANAALVIDLILLIALCLIIGSALDNSNLCVVRAARDLSLGKPAIAVGCLVTAAMGAIVFFANVRFGWLHLAPDWSYPTFATIAGAFIFGCGMLINGACAMGTVGRLARGDIGFVATLAGGAAATFLLPGTYVPSQMPDMALLTGLPWLVIVLTLTAVAVILSRRHLVWVRLAAFAILGLVAAEVTNRHGDWTWLSLAEEARSGMPFDFLALSCFVSVVAGASLTAIVRHRFRFVRPHWRVMLREGIGGGMMATGALLIPGGNDALLVVGVPSGSPHALTSYVVIFGLVVASMRLAPVFRRWTAQDI